MDELLGALGIKGVKDYDDLTTEEQTTYRKLLETVQQSQITPDDMKQHIKAMRYSLENELASLEIITEKDREHDRFLKARLKNYILFEAFLDRPQRAKEMLEQYKTRIQRG